MRSPNITLVMTQYQAACEQSRQSLIARWLREPLLHLLLIGALLFAFYYARNPKALEADDVSRIEITSGDLRQMKTAWTSQWGREPSPAETRRMVEARVREEILSREAVALGLDQDDVVIRRRLAQKMDFLSEDVADLREPTVQELQAWLNANWERFALPPRITFHHLYFADEVRGDRAQSDALAALAQLSGQPGDSPRAATLGDKFMYERAFADRAPAEVAAIFGVAFADALLKFEPGTWSGPLQSGVGWHLVFIDSITPSQPPAFDDVQSLVLDEWAAEQRSQVKRNALEKLRQRYEIILPGELENVAEPAE